MKLLYYINNPKTLFTCSLLLYLVDILNKYGLFFFNNRVSGALIFGTPCNAHLSDELDKAQAFADDKCTPKEFKYYIYMG